MTTKKLEAEAANSKEVSCQNVRDERQAQINLNRDLDTKVDQVLQEISQTETEMELKRTEVRNRETFYAEDYLELTDKVQLLEKRLSEMIFQFDEMKANLHTQVENSRLQEEERTQSNLEKQRLRAIEYAIERLPPQQAQELRENRWLLSEASVHRDQIKVLYGQVEKLERRNLDLMNTVYTKRMDRLGMLMKSAKMNMPSDERIAQLTNTLGMSAADPEFSLSEIDLNATNFQAIQDANSNPSKVIDFEQQAALDFRMKHTQSTDMMNKVAGLMVQGHHEHVQAGDAAGPEATKNMIMDDSENEQWPVTAQTLRNALRESGSTT